MKRIEIIVQIPSLLAHCVEQRREITVQAASLQEALDRLVESYPLLKTHLFSEDGRQREHVLFFYNEENTRWLDSLDIPLRPGDRLTVLQAVSGG